MKMIIVALRCFFFFGIIVAYSSGVWNLINGYFGKEFHAYLAKHPTAAVPEHGLPRGLSSPKTTIDDVSNVGAIDPSESAGRPGGCAVSKEPHDLLQLHQSMQMNEDDNINNNDNNNKWMMDRRAWAKTCDSAGDDNNIDNRKEAVNDDDDGGLTSALNHNPMDETWRSNYYCEIKGEPTSTDPNGSRSTNDNGEWSNNWSCSERTSKEEEAEAVEDEDAKDGYRVRLVQKDEESCRNE